jgi:hypothetical protein
MKCPNCNNKISIFRAKDEFVCPKCQAKLKSENYLRDFFISTAPFVIMGTIITAFIENIILMVGVEFIMFILMMCAFSGKIKLHVVKEQINKPKDEITI